MGLSTMATKNQMRTKTQRKRMAGALADKHKIVAEKRMKTIAKGKNVKSRLAELTAELDMQMEDVLSLYTRVRVYNYSFNTIHSEPLAGNTCSIQRTGGDTEGHCPGR